MLDGINRTCGKKRGGVKSIAIIGADSVNDVIFDPALGTFTDVILSEGSLFRKYCFPEDKATFSEKISAQSGVVCVNHELSFTVDSIDTQTVNAIMKLATLSNSGLIALVENQNGAWLILGYSLPFGKERPLRLQSAKTEYGHKYNDTPCEIISLVSEDVTKALFFVGDTALLMAE